MGPKWAQCVEKMTHIIVANPHGFCAGVDRAILIVERCIDLYKDKTIYVFHEIVHNTSVLTYFRKRGVIFVESVSEVKPGSILIFSAHGVSKSVKQEASSRNLQLIDASCPLVIKVHREAQAAEQLGKEIVLIGHKNHAEVQGTIGQVQKSSIHVVESEEDAKTLKVRDQNNIYCITQTTLSVDDTKAIKKILQNRFPSISSPPTMDICFATQNRQNAVKKLAQHVEMIFVIGSKNSSNSQRLKEVGIANGTSSFLIESFKDIKRHQLDDMPIIGISSGASAPEYLVEELIDNLQTSFQYKHLSYLTDSVENIKFHLPKELRL